MSTCKVTTKFDCSENKPWELIKTDPARCGTVIAVALNLARLIGTVLEPYMPAFQEKLLRQLNWHHELIPDQFTLTIPAGHSLGKSEILFKLIDEKNVPIWRQQFGTAAAPAPADTFPVDIRGATVLSVDAHPQDSQLFLVKLDLGTEQRQAVARLKAHYSADQLVGKQVVVLCNLPVADIQGAKSECMILVAEGKKKKDEATAPSRVLEPQTKQTLWNGVPIIAQGATLAVKPNITLKEFQKLDIKLDKDNKVVFKQKFPLQSPNKINLTADGIQGPAKCK